MYTDKLTIKFKQIFNDPDLNFNVEYFEKLFKLKFDGLKAVLKK